MFKFILLIFAASLASLGFAEAVTTIQEYPEPIFQEEVFMSGDWFAKILGIIAACMIALRGIGECLTRYAASTENTWDDGIAKSINRCIWYLGTMLGKFGYGAPNENVKKAAKKTIKL